MRSSRRRHLRLGRHAHPLARHRLPRRVAGARPGRASNADHDAPRSSRARLHAAGETIWGGAATTSRARRSPTSSPRPGSTHDPELLTAYYEFWEPHTLTDPEVGPMFEALRAEGIKVGVLSNTIWPRAWHEGFFERDGVLPPDRRRRLHQRDPVDQAVAAGVPGGDGGGRRRPTRPAASTSATGSSTTSGARTTPAAGDPHPAQRRSRRTRSATPRASRTPSCDRLAEVAGRGRAAGADRHRSRAVLQVYAMHRADSRSARYQARRDAGSKSSGRPNPRRPRREETPSCASREPALVATL